MRRRTANSRLMIDASCVLQKTVGVLSEPEQGAAMRASGTIARRIALCRMRVESSRSKLVRFSTGLVYKTKSLKMSGGQG